MNEAYSQDGNRVKHRARRSDDFLLPPVQTYPLVEPGRYVGVTTKVTKKNYRGAREYLAVSFDLFASAEALGNGEVPIARGVPGYFNLAGGGAASNYAKLVRLVFPDHDPRQRLRSSDLVGKAFVVAVATVNKDGDEQDVAVVHHYSKVSEVFARA